MRTSLCLNVGCHSNGRGRQRQSSLVNRNSRGQRRVGRPCSSCSETSLSVARTSKKSPTRKNREPARDRQEKRRSAQDQARSQQEQHKSMETTRNSVEILDRMVSSKRNFGNKKNVWSGLIHEKQQTSCRHDAVCQ